LNGGRRTESEAWWQKATGLANRRGDAESALIPLSIEALVHTLDGRLEEAVAMGERLLNLGADRGQEQMGRNFAGRAVRRALVYLGRPNEALTTVPEPLALYTNNGVFWGQRALILAEMGRKDECDALLDRFLQERDLGSQDDPTPTASLRYFLEAAATTGHEAMCRALYPRLAPLAGRVHYETWMLYCIGRSVGAAAALLGEPDKARGYYQQAIPACEQIRFRPELALTRLQLAELLLDEAAKPSPFGRGQGEGESPAALHTAAIAHLDFAIAEFRGMKMQPSLERALRRRELLTA
jgi:tetratricopeptide (TPR) repeat protein